MHPINPEGGALSFADLIVSDNALSNQLQRWATRKKQQEVVLGMFRKLNLDKYVERIRHCANVLLADARKRDEDKLEVNFHSPQYCRIRHCPVCQRQRSMKWLAIFHDAIPELLADNPSLRAIFLTLTIRNCPIEKLRETLREMSMGFSRLTRRKDWPSKAWIKTVEITRGQDGTAHPHLHVVMFLEPKYFSGRGYIKHERWREMWRDCLGVDYLPMVNVQTVKPRKTDNKGIANCEEVIQYAVKYGIKQGELVEDVDWFGEFHKQVYKTRAISIGGELRQYVKKAKEDYKASLETVDAVASTDDQTDDVSHESQGSQDEILSTATFAWSPRRGQYVELTEETLEDVGSDLMDGIPFGEVIKRLMPYPVWEFLKHRDIGRIFGFLIRSRKWIRKTKEWDIGSTEWSW